MGACISGLGPQWKDTAKTPMKILIVGLNSAGKFFAKLNKFDDAFVNFYSDIRLKTHLTLLVVANVSLSLIILKINKRAGEDVRLGAASPIIIKLSIFGQSSHHIQTARESICTFKKITLSIILQRQKTDKKALQPKDDFTMIKRQIIARLQTGHLNFRQ